DWMVQVEIPLANILTKSELKGIKIDRKRLTEIRDTLKLEIDSLQLRLHKLVSIYFKDTLFNPDSPKQLQELLFVKLKIKPIKKTKTGQYSTDTSVLEKLAKNHAIPKLLLEYKEKKKILSTYTDSILDELDSDDRIHGTFNQCGTATRRFSSSDPNLQNIPVKSAIGKEIRKCFIADKGYKFWDYDLNQIELRLLAHFSKDPALIKWFKDGEDIHQKTADLISKRLNKPFDRSKGKLLNFSILYGKTAYGFAKDWNTTEEVAQEIINAWFFVLPKVKEWMENQVRETRKGQGWTKSLAGLPLFVDGLFSCKSWEREHSERMAVNYPIQASSQDVLKQIVVKIYKELDIYPILFVHDQIVFEVPDKWIRQKDQINGIIESVVKLEVPVLASFKESKYWSKDE
ncbi:MAG: DNA polymerase, partial [Nitrososphaerales archaeon]